MGGSTVERARAMAENVREEKFSEEWKERRVESSTELHVCCTG